MSDDKYVGLAFGCVPRRLFALVLAVLLCSYGSCGILWALLMRHLPGEAGPASWHAEDRCVGHRCSDVFTCRGFREATFHFREVIIIVTAAPFGYWGVLGGLHRHVQDLHWFGCFLIGWAAFLAITVFFDGAYTWSCEEYPLNVVDEGLLWWWPRFPVREAVKLEVRDKMVSYPISFVNQLAMFNVFTLYAAVEFAAVLFFAYAGAQVLRLAYLLCHGADGLGSNFDIRDWRERVILKHNIEQMLQPDYHSTTRDP